jgi:hypothetical protein
LNPTGWSLAATIDRHFAAHPEDRDANIVIFEFYDEDMADEGQDCTAPSAKPTALLRRQHKPSGIGVPERVHFTEF